MIKRTSTFLTFGTLLFTMLSNVDYADATVGNVKFQRRSAAKANEAFYKKHPELVSNTQPPQRQPKKNSGDEEIIITDDPFSESVIQLTDPAGKRTEPKVIQGYTFMTFIDDKGTPRVQGIIKDGKTVKVTDEIYNSIYSKSSSEEKVFLEDHKKVQSNQN